MEYTVKKLAKASGVSVRTLHFYDEIGLLKPAFVGANGYRFYGEAQLLRLQQILFYRELGFDLKEIKRVIGRRGFERVTALQSHRKALLEKIEREQQLIVTIDKTIEHLKGKRKMKTEEMFVGFSPEVQAKHEEYLVDRFGPTMKSSIEESKGRVKNWTKSDWERSGAEFNSICADLVSAMKGKEPAESAGVQAIIRRHFEWLKQFWMPNKESYVGHGCLITDSDLRKPFEAHDPGLPAFMAAGMRVFAERELK
jgi:DNA-binding transcriptional MerR regulator